MIKRLVGILTISFSVVFCSAQNGEEGLQPLNSNSRLKAFHKQHPAYVFGQEEGKFYKNGITDTLNLPFFDDFSTSSVYPDASLWINNAVFINPDFPINPPSINVATFDGLDPMGNAYEDIDASFFGAADTLISQPIDLSTFSPSDSVILSFFYQAQGRSFEVLESTDSLVVQFRNRIGAWVNVWSTLGIAQQEFKAASMAVNDTSFFHGVFQFRIMNYQKFIGNLKQWHVDYIYLNQGRTLADTVYQDQAVVYKPESPLQTFTHLPWSHLGINFSKFLKTSLNVPVNNLSNTGETFSVEVKAEDKTGLVGFNKLSGQSLPASGQTSFVLNPSINLFSSADDTNYLRVVTKISDILGGNDVKSNDSAVRYVELANYYAYDDGTAETGYGIRNGSGSVAYGFELQKGDTIRAVSIHFTQAEAPVTTGVQLNIWKELAPVGQPSQNGTILLHTMSLGIPAYTDTINGFHLYRLDTAFYVSDKVFIGWTQSSSFMLNVGFDRNYRNNGQDTTNPNLFYNVGGKWETTSVNGTPMIRPHFGKYIPNPLSVSKKAEIKPLKVYPNPSHSSVFVQSEDDLTNVNYQILGLNGQVLLNGQLQSNEIKLDNLKPGIYFLKLKAFDGSLRTTKIVKY